MARGRLITIEGIDGSGKSTLAIALSAEIERRGGRVQLLHEPGGVQLSERIRTLLADPALQIGAATEALLYAAARAELVSARLAPLLQRGTDVLLDRFIDSSLAYQGAGRELGIERVRTINELACGGLVPDRTLLLEIPPALARERLRARGEAPDRLEGEQEAFFERVADAYREIAEAEPERVVSIDATLAPERVLELAIFAIEDPMPNPGR
ncbi:MAG TPA: dTMP kinase [Solirubrobacteraceae bacterium]|nr:dTMP kinase [Solirubrobacteraceae bacterium]